MAVTRARKKRRASRKCCQRHGHIDTAFVTPIHLFSSSSCAGLGECCGVVPALAFVRCRLVPACRVTDHLLSTRLGHISPPTFARLLSRVFHSHTMSMDLPTETGEPGPANSGAPSSPGHYAFLNHSTSTVPHNLPPKADNKPLVRQKRKRTRYIRRTLGTRQDSI